MIPAATDHLATGDPTRGDPTREGREPNPGPSPHDKAGWRTGALAQAYLDHHLALRPVDATFMGIGGHDDALPDASAGAASTERAGVARLRALLASTPSEDGVGARLDRRLVAAQLAIAEATPQSASRFANPAWYTGEAAFGIIGLLLPRSTASPSAPARQDAVAARLAAIPDFLSDGRARLTEAKAAPRAFVARAGREAVAMAAFLTRDVHGHPHWDPAWAPAATRAAQAFTAFAEDVAVLPDRPAACGVGFLEQLMGQAHGLTPDADAAIRQAEADFARLDAELVEMAAALDPRRSWREQVEALADVGPGSPAEVLDRYREFDRRARAAGGPLLKVEDGYRLDYRPIPPWFQGVAGALYFLFYRSPPAAAPGEGSVYWVSPPAGEDAAYLRANADATVKIVHAVHHGSVGHHTQNARARTAESTLARLAGTDCALGLAFLSAGSMVEGWACYVQDMMQEAQGFYTPSETLLLKSMERRNVASILVDVRLHTGAWTPDQARDFYIEEAGFAPARAEGEVTRNAMLPATRLMYWLGVQQIRALRARWRGDARSFHDTLIGYGHVPVAWAGEEMARAGGLR